MRVAKCECGHTVTHESTTVIARQIRHHVKKVHPGMQVYEQADVEHMIRKARQYGPHAAVIFLLYPKRTSWTVFFGRSTLAGEDGGIYAVRRKLSIERNDALWQIVRDLDAPHGVRTRMFDRGTAAATFLDGGIVRVTPAYLGHIDTWVVGSDALRLLCFKLDLIPPRRLKGELRVLTGIELEAAYVVQREAESDTLEERLNGYLNW